MDNKAIAEFVFGESLRILVPGVVLFWCAGRIDWWPAWAALAATAAMHASIGLIGLRASPGLLAERVGPREGDAPWDVAVYHTIRLTTAASLVVAGLDQRHGWTGGVPGGIQIAALVVYLLGCTLFVWATASNMFFSVMVRIQTERGHTVATGGPYRYVRHPGYVGAIACQLALPVLLASWYALALGLVVVTVYLVRTALEDHTLRLRLAGYADFAQRVRYRLLPGIW